MQGIGKSHSSGKQAQLTSPEFSGQVTSALRPWLNLWLTIHFFALAVCLASNFASSELERRILRVLAPYTVGLHQDYGGVPLEMTRGTESDHQLAVQVHVAGEPSDQWQTVEPHRPLLAALDQRHSSFQHMVALAASEKNEELVLLLLERSVSKHRGPHVDATANAGPAEWDGIRLVRRVALSYAADRSRMAGQLPVEQLQDQTLYEYRVVYLDGQRVKLLPVLESTRTSKSLVGDPSSGQPRPHAAPVSAVPGESGS